MSRRERARARPPRQETRWPRTLSLWCLALTFLLGLASFGAYLNDEGAQLQSLYNLRQGNLAIEEEAPQFYAVQEGVLLPSWNGTNPQSGFVSFAALPAYAVLKVTSFLVSPPHLLLLGWTLAAYVTATRGIDRLHRARTGRPWRWHTRDGELSWRERFSCLSVSHWSLLGGLALFLVTQAVQLPSLSFGTWGEVFAIQATHTLLAAAAFVLFYRIVQHETGSPGTAALLGAVFLVGPVTFWGVGIKYHAPSVFLAVAALWLYRRPAPWRYAAFAVAAVGVWNTILAAALLLSLALVEAPRLVRAGRSGELPRNAVVALGASVVGGMALVLAYNRFVVGNWLGRRGLTDEQLRSGGLGLLWDWTVENLRYDSAATSVANLYRLFVDSRAIEGFPLAMLALTPLAVLAFLAPWRLRGRWTPVLRVSLVHAVVFLLVFIHGAHTQGDGQDNRFFLLLLPTLLLLAAAVVAPRVAALEQEDARRGVRTYLLGTAGVFAALLVMGATGIVLAPSHRIQQVLLAAWIVGSLAWPALLVLEAFHDRWAERLGAAGLRRAWSATLAWSLVPGTVWLFLMMILANRQLPPWPFFEGHEGMSFLLPSLDAVREWWLPKIVPASG